VFAALIGATGIVTGCAIDPGVQATRADQSPLSVPSPDSAPETSPDTDPPATSPGTSTPPDDPNTPPPASSVPVGQVELADVADVGDGKEPRPYDDVVAASLADLEQWWSTTYPALYGDEFEPLGGGVYPSYPGRTDVPGCGDVRTQHPDVAQYVAFYCAIDDFLVYDDGPDSLLGSLTTDYGPAIMGVVLAHEYAHAVQARAGDLDRGLPTVLTEQQADCFAGAWVGRAVLGESPIIRLGDADVRGGLVAMVTVRDPVGIDQFVAGGHGSAFDRVGAFQEGFNGGPERCAGLLDEPLPLMPNRFNNTLDEVNEGDLAFGYEGDTIVPLIVGALGSYWTFALGGLGTALGDVSLVPVDAAGRGRVRRRARRHVDRGARRRDGESALRGPDRGPGRLRGRLPRGARLGRARPVPLGQHARRRGAGARERLPRRCMDPRPRSVPREPARRGRRPGHDLAGRPRRGRGRRHHPR
jgi:predicted metalloprotease